MYGPPPDPSEIPVDVAPALWVGCVTLGLAISALVLLKRLPDWLRAGLFALGQVLALTAPLGLSLGRWVYGSWPTIDKTGSLQFYLDGAHIRLYSAPIASLDDPAVQLIGVHLGHHWPTSLFDLVLPTFGAINAQALLYMLLGWLGAALFVHEWLERPRSFWIPLFAGFPFGMGLHVFRDLNWYTIEKTAVGLLALFAWGALRASRDWRQVWLPVLLFLVTALVNLYLALVGALGLLLVTAFTLPDWRRAARLGAVGLGCLVVVAPLAWYQSELLSRVGGQLADPEAYLYQRAALDNFSLRPLMWNRLEVWRALNLPLIGLAVAALPERRTWPLVGTAVLLWALSLGPFPAGVEGFENPLYMLLRAVFPGFWRVATPEVFFEGSYLLLLACGALGLSRLMRRVPWLEARPWALWPLMLVGWLALVRTHPVYPGFSEFVDVPLAQGWQQRLD